MQKGQTRLLQLRSTLSGIKKPLILAFVLSGFMSLLQLALPIYSMQIFDRVLMSGSLSTLALLTFMLVIVTVSSTLIDASRGLMMASVASLLDIRLSRATFQSEALNDREALRDIDLLRNFVSGSMAAALLDAPWAFAFVVTMFLLHAALGLITILSVCLMLCCSLLSYRASRESQIALLESSGRVDRVLISLHVGNEAVGAMGRKRILTHHISQLRHEAAMVVGRLCSHRSWVEACARALRTIAQIAILATTAVLVISQDIQTGAIVASSMLFGRAVAPFERIGAGTQAIASVLAASRRTMYRLQGASDATPKLPLPDLVGDIAVCNLCYLPSSHHAAVVDRASFRITPGTVTVIVGPEGAGKSTLARLMVGALSPTAGEIRIDGSSMKDFDASELGSQIGYLAQTPMLGSGSVAKVIAGDAELDPEEVINAASLVGAHAMIQRLSQGYQTLISNEVPQLSAGERQRIALARAVYKMPSLIVLDEPTTHLDDLGESYFVSTIKTLKAHGCTIVIVSRCPALLPFTDQMIMLERGRVRLRMDGRELHSVGPRLAATSLLDLMSK